MRNIMKNGYKEVKIDNNGRGIDKTYHNPLTRVYQYEYALYSVVSELFGSIRCRSLCMNNLESYFLELPIKGDEDNAEKNKNGKKTQDGIIEEISKLVERDVIGKIKFPMINICAAEMVAMPEKDGTHTFVFTDGIYGFALHMVMPGRGREAAIKVEQLYPLKRKEKLAG